MYIALKDIKVQVINPKDGSRTIETRHKGEPVPEAATWKNPGPWIRRGEITDEDGAVWKGGLNTGIKITEQGPVVDLPEAPTETVTVATPATAEAAQALSEMRAVVPAPTKPAREVGVALIEIPTIADVLEAGYTERAAVGIIARQTALAAGKSEEESNAAHFVAMEAYDAKVKAALADHDEKHQDLEIVEPASPLPVLEQAEEEPGSSLTSLGITSEEADQLAPDETTYSVSPDPEPAGPGLPPMAPEIAAPSITTVFEPVVTEETIAVLDPAPLPDGVVAPDPASEVPPPDPPAAPPKLTRKKLSVLTKAELIETGDRLGIKLPSYTRKGTMIKKILDAQG
jgi:hypothetical protein